MWTLKAPDAQLFDIKDQLVGKHLAGPSWQSNDGSRVVGKVAVTVASPDAESIPWLLVKVTSHTGNGVLARATTIQRLNTEGGKAPGSGYLVSSYLDANVQLSTDNNTYFNGSVPNTLLIYNPSSGVAVTITEGTAAGWGATAAYPAGTTRTCSVFYGSATAPPPATIEGQVACTP